MMASPSSWPASRTASKVSARCRGPMATRRQRNSSAASMSSASGVCGFSQTSTARRRHIRPSRSPGQAVDLAVRVVLHTDGVSDAGRLSRFYFNNVIGNPLETSIALHYLIFDGVLERHAKLKILAVHGGGYLAACAGRIDHAWGARSDSHGNLPHPPTTYLKRIYFDSIVFTPHQLQGLVRLYGVDHIVMGTDYPFDMADYDPIGHVAASSFDAATMAAICGSNAKALLGL